MQLILGNPAGLWALLGIPAVLLIHFIQQRTKTVQCSTLFLVPQVIAQSTYSRSIDWLRSSWNLWLQILAVLIISWLLLEPRRLHESSTQKVVVVLDGSISMNAFLPKLQLQLPAKLKNLSLSAAKTEWIMIESDLNSETLYSGADLADLSAKLSNWKPSLGTHDLTPALEFAQRKAGVDGSVILVTDHKQELREGIDLFALGSPVLNVGFAGVQLDQAEQISSYQMLVRNYSDQPVTRKWWIESGGSTSKISELQLAANGIVTLRGKFPQGIDQLTVVLEEDGFTTDDRLPLLVPQKKMLSFWIQPGVTFSSFANRILKGTESAKRVTTREESDIIWESLESAESRSELPGRIIFGGGKSENRRIGIAVAESASLAAGLDWGGLLAAPTRDFLWQAGDQAVVWQAEAPLILERRSSLGASLLLNFHLPISNATRHPGFVVLLHRFIESVRSAKIELEHQNFELHQSINLAVDIFGPDLSYSAWPASGAAVRTLTFSPRQATLMRTPAEPALFEISQGKRLLLRATTHLADTREADLRAATSVDSSISRSKDFQKLRSEESLFTPLWALLLIVIMLLNWCLPKRAALGRASGT